MLLHFSLRRADCVSQDAYSLNAIIIKLIFTANICWRNLPNIAALFQQISISEIVATEAFPIFHSTFLLFVSAGFLNKSTS